MKTACRCALMIIYGLSVGIAIVKSGTYREIKASNYIVSLILELLLLYGGGFFS